MVCIYYSTIFCSLKNREGVASSKKPISKSIDLEQVISGGIKTLVQIFKDDSLMRRFENKMNAKQHQLQGKSNEERGNPDL